MKEDLVNKVYDKVHKEYLDYIESVKKLSPEKIIELAYPITIKQEIVDMFYGSDYFNKFQLLALLEKEDTLQFLYEVWENADGGIHTVIEEVLDDDFYDLGVDYENKVMKKIETNHNFTLIEDISFTLSELDRYDFCTHIKDTFNVDDLDSYDIDLILKSKDGAKYLYDFCDQIRNEEQVLYLEEVQVINTEASKNIADKILPKLKIIIEEQEKNNKPKVKERDER